MIKDSSCHFGIDKALDTVANLTEISGSKLDVKKTGVAIITTRLVGIMAESLVSNFGKGGKNSETFFSKFGHILKTPIQITYPTLAKSRKIDFLPVLDITSDNLMTI